MLRSSRGTCSSFDNQYTQFVKAQALLADLIEALKDQQLTSPTRNANSVPCDKLLEALKIELMSIISALDKST